MTGKKREIILASGSAIRRQLLASAGVLFSVVSADVDEGSIRAAMTSESDCVEPNDVALALARAKAESVSRLHPDAIVIGADQVLWMASKIYEKPANMAEAREHLSRFCGRTHELHSAVVMAEHGASTWGTVEAAHMTMRPFSDAFLEAYMARAGERICNSVGAYEYEGLGLQLFDQVAGDYFTVLGLPMMPLLAELRIRGALLA
jgi:septum formation protein